MKAFGFGEFAFHIHKNYDAAQATTGAFGVQLREEKAGREKENPP